MKIDIPSQFYFKAYQLVLILSFSLSACEEASESSQKDTDIELPTLMLYDQYMTASKNDFRDLDKILDANTRLDQDHQVDFSQAGNQAGTQAGNQAGTQAGNQAGTQAGNQAGTQADIEYEPNAQGLIELNEELSQQWQLKRDCQWKISVYAPGINEVKLAGEFTQWEQNPITLMPIGNGYFEFNLTSAFGLMPNQRYAYKLIKDGRWVIDEGATLRKYDENCINSAFDFPDCEMPKVVLDRLNTSEQKLSASFWLYQPQSTALASIQVLVDQRPVSAYLDPITGQLWIGKNEGLALPLGKHHIDISIQDQSGKSSAALTIPFWIEQEPFLWQEQALYLLLIDRFANGDPSNDLPLRAPVRTEVDWHGGDLIGAKEVLMQGYFDELGVKAIWLSPVNQQTNGDFGDRELESRRIAAYHGYWPIKGREVEPRFGGNQALTDFVNAAHQRGIRVVLDLINNQVHQEHEYYLSHPDWFRTNCICGTAGCGWSERPLECLFASYLPDINWRNPDAEKQFIEDAISWIEDYDIDGFRVDAVKHVESSAIFNLRHALDQRFGHGLKKNVIGDIEAIDGQRIVMLGETAVGEGDRYNDQCGEIFNSGYEWIGGYMGEKALDGQFDFPTHHRIRWQLLSGQGSFEAVNDAFSTAELSYAPSALMVSFIGSHDTSRVVSQAEQGPFFGCAWASECTTSREADQMTVLKRLWRAWVVLYTQSFIPLLYYGDEIAIPGGIDPDNRRNMEFIAPLDQYQISFGNQEEQEEVSVLQSKQLIFFQILGQLKAEFKALIKANQKTVLYLSPDIWIYAYQMDQAWLLVALNQGTQPQSIRINAPSLSTLRWDKRLTDPNFNDFIGNIELQAEDNALQFTLSPESVQIFSNPR